jgi:hypothetical protein
VTYSTAMLKQWRAIAEQKAQFRQRYGDGRLYIFPHEHHLGLAPELLTLDASFTNDAVGQVMRLCCVREIWGGPLNEALRNFLIEYARNAFQHGNAQRVSVRFTDRSIVVLDDGIHYDLRSLAREGDGRGGGLAYRRLLTQLPIGATATRISASGTTELTIPLARDLTELERNNPCAIVVTHKDLRYGRVDFDRVSACDVIYLIAPEYFTSSDTERSKPVIARVMTLKPNVVLILPQASADVVHHFQTLFPGTTVLSWSSW